MAFNSDGSKMFVVGNANDDVHEYNLGTDFDVSTAVYVDGYDTTSRDANACGLAFSSDGTKMFIIGNSSNENS